MLKEKIKGLTGEIRYIEYTIKTDDTLREICEKAWKNFSSQTVTLIKVKEDCEGADPIERVANLQRKLLNCKAILEDYRRFLRDYPEVRTALQAVITAKPKFAIFAKS